MTTDPIIAYVEEAKGKFFQQYDFYPEKLHGSRAMIRVLHRWFRRQYPNATPTYDGAEVCGLQLLHSTKNSPHIEFWLSAERDGQVYSVHSRIVPKDVDAIKAMNPLMQEIISLATDTEREDDL